jgi:hypothetical protein
MRKEGSLMSDRLCGAGSNSLAAAGQPAQHEARISCFGKVEVTIAEGLNLAGDLVGLRARCQRETGGRYY